ncbi:hypothetical protein RUM43_013879 [Polyplax serrata]|uniref:Uncharacterized protein n=1 Tax=Polyplax serrata TaxID=468196 RepID=A0AAN8P4S6_POLSC
MNLWGRGSPRFPFIQPMQGTMDFAAYEQFPFQNPAWDVAHPAFAPNLCAPVQTSDMFYPERCNDGLNQNWTPGDSSPKPNKDEVAKLNRQNIWQYKPGSEYEEGAFDKNKKDFKDGKTLYSSSDRRSEKRERSDKHRDRDDRDKERDRSRHRSRDDRNASKDRRDSPDRRDRREHSSDRDWKSSERDSISKEKRSRERDRSKDRRDRDSLEKDQFGRDVPRSSRSSRERKDRSPKEKRKRDEDSDGHRRKDDSRYRDRDRERDDETQSKRHRISNDPMDSKFSLEAANYKTQTPNETVMIRGLAQHITENDIRQDILQCGMMPKDIRLIRKKETDIVCVDPSYRCIERVCIRGV